MVITLGSVIGLLMTLVILGVIVWLVNYVVVTLPIADPFGKVLRVVVMVICVLAAVTALLQFIGFVGPVGTIDIRP